MLSLSSDMFSTETETSKIPEAFRVGGCTKAITRIKEI